ncbi:hypothetical protein GFY24_38905 [Nocardia sp. SYP-A9097]|uniref:hypothetical protein n=1 Tax=Nocardia sp. SYP-A9097 TaxID=2663237 RepID=UPI00129B877A|nr:hypothetical protein [Nocardia sp. SYP-A9097]MRH93320.1 hypothetical protein [Nocardia sp. SYP-A9097]
MMEWHSFRLELPSNTPFARVEQIALEQVIFPHMARTGKNSYADLGVRGRVSGSAGMSTFTGEYLL